MANATQDPPLSAASVDSTASPETSFGSAPVCSITPIGTVTTPARERSGTIIVRPRWDSTLAPPMRRAEASGSTSTDDSQPETETEDDEDVNIDRDRAHTSPECLGNPPQTSPHTRRAAGIITGSPPTTTTRVSLEVDAGAHTIINNRLTASMKLESRTASFPSNPTMTLPWVPLLVLQALSRVSDPHRFRTSRTACRQGAQHERHPEGPYQDEGIILRLQLLDYLSKYPHVRQGETVYCVTTSCLPSTFSWLHADPTLLILMNIPRRANPFSTHPAYCCPQPSKSQTARSPMLSERSTMPTRRGRWQRV